MAAESEGFYAVTLSHETNPLMSQDSLYCYQIRVKFGLDKIFSLSSNLPVENSYNLFISIHHHSTWKCTVFLILGRQYTSTLP